MAITNILRDWASSVSIVRIMSTDSLATIGTAGYLTAQQENIDAINIGPFAWVPSDFILVYASNGWGLFTINPNFQSLTIFTNGISGTVTSITAGAGLSGGTITTTGTIALAAIADNTILSNISGGSAVPVANSLSNIINSSFTSAQGSLLMRGASAWNTLATGTSGQVLTSGGAGANLSWATPSSSGGTVTSITAGTGLTGGVITGSGTIALSTPVAIADGGTGVTSATTAPVASSFAAWDANKNMSANGFIPANTVRTASNITPVILDVTSTEIQIFNGTTNQEIDLPVTSTLQIGQSFYIINNTSTGTFTILSSGGDIVVPNGLSAGWAARVTVVDTTSTSETGWQVQAQPDGAYTFFGGVNTSASVSGGQVVYNATRFASFLWQAVTSSTQDITNYNGYFTNNGATPVTFTLPVNAQPNTFFRIAGYSSGGWILAQNADQSVRFGAGASTVGITGTTSSATRGDCIEVMCVVADTEWIITSVVGTPTQV